MLIIVTGLDPVTKLFYMVIIFPTLKTIKKLIALTFKGLL